MGRLFWKFFLSILLAQVAATVGIGGAVWLKSRNQQINNPHVDLDTSPPAEIAINSAAATLEYGGGKALRRMLENMDRFRVYAVDNQGHELLGRVVAPALLRESRDMLKEDNGSRAVRQVTDHDGNSYLLFLPWSERQRGLEGKARPLMAGAQLAMEAATSLPVVGGGPNDGGRRGPMPGQPGPGQGQDQQPPRIGGAGMPPSSAPVAADVNGNIPPQDQGPNGAPDRGFDGQGPGDRMQGPGGPGGGDQRGPWGPRFQPLTPWVPMVAAFLASLLFAVLLAWYFSRPIRALRMAFDAAAGGDLSPRFGQTGTGGGTELNDLGRDFDNMTARLRSLIDGQTRLLHDVSHELRSPLARLQAAIGLAHQQPDKVQASMERIERESVRMDKLVGELLTLARLEAGAIKASQEEISMGDLIEQIADDARYEATSQDRTVVQDGEAEVLVTGQADLLGRAIENVLRNAIKHSPEGGEVKLQLRVMPDARQLCIRVLDRGPGVAPPDLDLIFQPFFRSSNSSAEGHGLGLAIAQHVVTAHGGNIKATNREGGGLCVEIMLPVKR